MWLLWVMVVGACLADQPLASSQKTITSPLHMVNVKVAEAGDDFCATSLPLLKVTLGLLPYSSIRPSPALEPYSDIRCGRHTPVLIIGPFIFLNLPSWFCFIDLANRSFITRQVSYFAPIEHRLEMNNFKICLKSFRKYFYLLSSLPYF